MFRNIKQFWKTNTKQDWLHTGQIQLNDQMSGVLDISTLAKQIISFLTNYVEAQAGVFYLSQEKYLKVIATYGYTTNKDIPQKFEFGEGLVGETAIAQKMISRTQTPEESTKIIQSCMTVTVPRHVLLIPVLFEKTVIGVIEIGFSNHAPTSLQQHFLQQQMPNIGRAINSIQDRIQIQVLIEQNKKQTIDLQNKSVELQVQRDELRISHEKIDEYTQKTVDHVTNQHQSNFLSKMSHELRTPLNSLLILAQRLANNTDGNLTETQVKQAQTISEAGTDLLFLINEILDLSHLEAGKIDVHLDNASLLDLVNTLEQKFHQIAEDKGLTFQITVADDIAKVLHTDQSRLKQILDKLLSNAFKFTTTGKVKMTVERSSQSNMITFKVIDSGVGVDKDKQGLIFESFQQIESNINLHGSGTGIGLSISSKLAQALGGDLKLHSEVDKGSTFTLSLPSQCEVEQVTTLPDIPILEDRKNLKEQLLLIIEDDPLFAQLLTELAQDKNFKCIIAADGVIGLKMAQEYLPNAIILDVGLPKMDGWSVMDKLKENPDTRHIPVHFITGSGSPEDAKNKGAIGYLHKPANLAQLDGAFDDIKQFIAKTVKNVLILVENDEHQQQIVDLVEDKEVQVKVAITKIEALKHLQLAQFDCIILDVDVEQGTGLKLLEPLYNDSQLSKIPVIAYADRDLTSAEDSLLQQCMDTLTIKTVTTPERLLDQSTLFLHQEKACLSENKQQILHKKPVPDRILAHQNVLIVDDDIRNTFALTTVLEDKQMEVFVANNGKEALALLEENQNIDIVIMDIMMPEMDGYETMQKIREQVHLCHLPIIALTAKTLKGDKEKCIEAGANDYLAKPVDTEALLSLMRVWLSQ